jgi:transcriptional regulator with XRE-family HTH domain
LNNRIKQFRERQGLSQVELARRAHTAGPNLSAVERGERKAWPKLRRNLARVLKTSQNELFRDEKEPSNEE